MKNNNIQFRIARHNEINGGFFDRYSLVHLLSGVLAAKGGLTYSQGLILHLLFEASENTIKVYTPHILDNYTFDSFRNTMSDNVFFLVGMYLSREFTD